MEKTGKFSLVFRQAALILLLLLVSVIFFESCFYLGRKNDFLPNNTRKAAFCIIPGVILLSGTLIMLFHRISRIKRVNEKKVTFVLWGIILVFQAIIVYLLIRDGFKGITDTARVINEAIAMIDTQQGRINNEAAYFARYGNNYPFTILIYYICKTVRFFGFECYTAVLIALNVIMIDCSGIFAMKIIKMFGGNIAGIKFLFLFLLSPTTYMWIIYTYTNTFSMPFVTGLLYYGIRAVRMEEHRIRNLMISAVIGAIGFQIRPTTIIPLIALIFGIFLAAGIHRKREKCIMVLLVVSIFAGMMFTSSCFYRNHLVNREQDRTFPFTHWVMMGLNTKKNGAVYGKDVKFTKSMPTRQEKIKGNLKKIRARLLKMGPDGYAGLLMKKMELVWAAGDDGSRRYHVDGENISGIHQYTYGDKGGFLAVYCQVFRSSTFLFVLISIFSQIRRRGEEGYFVISLTVLGIIMFLLLWETNQKYNICFMPLFYVLMGDGITQTLVCARRADILHGFTQNKYYRLGIRLFFILIPLFLSQFMIADYPYYIREKSDYHEAIISNVSYKEENRVLEKKGDVAEQTFITNRCFNEIGIMSKNEKIDENSYRFQILDKNGNPVPIRNVSLKKNSRTKSNWFLLHLDTVTAAEKPQKYTIQIKCLKNNKQGFLVSVTPFADYDLYTGGNLMINSRPMQRDMAFCVAYGKKDSLLGTDGYIIFGLAVWVWSGVLCWFFSRRR